MLQKIFFTLVLVLSLAPCTALSQAPEQLPPSRFAERDPLDNMPILETEKFGTENPAPIPKRGPEYRKFLSASVKIGVSGGSGSGTIIHYDPKDKLAYVASCGHLWTPGVLEVEAAKKKSIKCNIIIWYQNDKKLDAPKTYEGTVIFYSYIDGQDTSLVTFKPDWEPTYFPLGPANYEYRPGQHGHSCGSDAGSEVAHYDIKFIGIQGNDLVTNENSPRPGRSGGGLMNDEGQYIGTCWGTQYRDGTGKGFFTPLFVIHRFWAKQKGYEWLLNQKAPSFSAKTLRIVDRSGKNESLGADYILIPN